MADIDATQNQPHPKPPATGFWESVRTRVRGHPLVIIGGLVIGTITGTLSLAVPVMDLTRNNELAAVRAELASVNSAHEAEAAELRQSLSSIQLALGTDGDYLDVSGLVITRDQANAVPAGSVAFPDDRFYALDTAKTSGWEHLESTELANLAEMFGMSEDATADIFGLNKEQRELLTALDLDVWRLGAPKVLSIPDASTGSFTNLHVPAQVLVQRVDHDTLEEALVTMYAATADAETVRRLYRLDPTGGILQRELLLQSANAGTIALVDSLQKRGPIAYAKLENALFDLKVDGVDVPQYFLERDVLIVTTDRDAYLVKRMYADDDRRSDDIAALNQWLDLFRVCRDC